MTNEQETLLMLRGADFDWLYARYRTNLFNEDRRKLFLIRSLRVLADEEKRIAEMTDEQIANEIQLYGADRLRTL